MKNILPLIVIAGPCVVESKEMLRVTASFLKDISLKYNIRFFFKSSYKKANRTSMDSFTGLGDEKALRYMLEIKEEFDVSTITDIHSPWEADLAAKYVDALQIPAFLCRQTELLVAAGLTGKIVNIKKGQFMAPEDMEKAVQKVKSTACPEVWLTERGTSFGYHNLVVDFRSLPIMRSFAPVIFDATHSVQMPSLGAQSGGAPRFIPFLARASAAVGIDGLFFETHPEPLKALSDSATQLPLNKTVELIETVLNIREAAGDTNSLIY